MNAKASAVAVKTRPIEQLENNAKDASLIERLAAQLSPGELDALKYRLSVAAIQKMGEGAQGNFDLGADTAAAADLLQSLVNIQPYRDRIPTYGLAYRGRPNFMTDDLLKALQQESSRFRASAKRQLDQYISQIHTDNSSTVCEQLAASEELLALVRQQAGPALRSYITSYLYYDTPGQYSQPHVDNAFTSITVMVGLAQENAQNPANQQSSSVIFWPHSPRLDYRLQPGELSIFFGASVLHGRTRVASGESVRSLLMSFRPDLSQ